MISKYRLFIVIIIPAALVLAVGMILIHQKNDELSSRQFENQLKNQWDLAALLVEDPAYQTELARLQADHGLRLTLIDTKGDVLSDSAVSGPLESHRNREEVKSAFAGSPLMVVRYSLTTDSSTIYYARQLPDGKVLRVAYPAEYYDVNKDTLIDQVIVGLIILMTVVVIFALIISQKMSGMLKSLSRAVKVAQVGGHDLPSFNNPDIDKALFALSTASRDIKLYSEENLNLRKRLEYILANIDEGVIFLAGGKVLYHNRRVEDILNFKIPEDLANINNQKMMDIFGALMAGKTGDMRLEDRTIVVSQTVSETSRLILMHDVSDRERYSGYKSDLVGNISHELKTPLALIMGASEVILKDPEMPRSYLDKFLNTIYKNTHRINLLLDDLVFLHKLEGTRECEADESDLGEVVDDLKELLGQMTKHISYEFDPAVVNIQATHLISVLTNLISNANKYSQGDTIEVEMRKKGNTLEIKVADQGPQIPQTETNRIFERFYTLSTSRNRGESGSGLGLSIVKHIARIYKGQAAVEHNKEGGNTFVVRLVEN